MVTEIPKEGGPCLDLSFIELQQTENEELFEVEEAMNYKIILNSKIYTNIQSVKF